MIFNKKNRVAYQTVEANSYHLQKIPIKIYLVVAFLVTSYLLCVVQEWIFFYFFTIFCAVVIVTAFFNFEAAFLYIPIVLFNPYMLVETGSSLLLSEVVLIIIFIVWSGRIILLRERIEFPKKFLILSLAIIIPASLSLFRAPYLVVGIKQVVRFIELFLFFLIVVIYSCKTEKRITQVFISLIFGGLIASCIAIGQYINNVIILRESTRVFGWHGGNEGAFLASTIVLSISALWYKSHYYVKMLSIVTIPIACLALLVSQTRTWIGAFLIVMAILFFLQKRGSFRKSLAISGIIISLIFIIVQTNVFGLVDSKFFLGALQGASRFGTTTGAYSTTDLSLLMRLNAWRKGIEIYLSHPIFGYGIGNVRFADYFTLKLGKPGEGVGYVDNQYLQIFAEAGTIAGIALIAYMVIAVKLGIKSLRSAEDSELYIPAVGLFGCLLICVIGSNFWVLTVDHELFALTILYIGLLMNILRLQVVPKHAEK